MEPAMVETNRPFLYAVNRRLGSLSKLFHRDTSVETHGNARCLWQRAFWKKKLVPLKFSCETFYVPSYPTSLPGGWGGSLSSLRPVQTRLVLHGVLVMLSTLVISSHIPPFLGQVFLLSWIFCYVWQGLVSSNCSKIKQTKAFKQ